MIRASGSCWCWRRATIAIPRALDSIDLLTHRAQTTTCAKRWFKPLRYDKNPGVRLKSLDGLKGYVKDDVHVRDAVVEALLHDNNAGVRHEAIACWTR